MNHLNFKKMNTPLKSLWLLAITTLVLSCNDIDQSSNKKTKYEKNAPEAMSTTTMKNAPKTLISNDIYTQAAIETCNCVQPWLEKMKQLNEFQSNKQYADMKKMASEMDEIQPQIQRCSDEIQNKYSKHNIVIDEKRIKQAIMTQCPDLATILSSRANVK